MGRKTRHEVARLTLSCESVELWLAERLAEERVREPGRGDTPLSAPLSHVPHAIQHHLKVCPVCHAEQRDALPLGRIVYGERCPSNGGGRVYRDERFSGGRLGTEGSDPMFVRAVMANVRQELPPNQRRRARRHRRQRVLAAAAALIMGVGVWGVIDHLPTHSGGPPHVQDSGAGNKALVREESIPGFIPAGDIGVGDSDNNPIVRF